MVKTLTPPHTRKASCHRASIVEIVGVAGAGKSTLYRALAKSISGIRTEELPPIKDVRFIPFFVKNILFIAPMLVPLLRKGGTCLTRRELAWMAMLMGWPKILNEKVSGNDNIILLDQGPIFLMAILSEFGPEHLRTPDMQNFWEKVYGRWVNALDMVIWLDTMDEILLDRIRTRQTDHPVKAETDVEIKGFLAKYRRAYEHILSKLTMNNPDLQVLKMDTGENSVDDIVQNVLQSLPIGMRSL
jgi:deoxyadenosine/deoxycytidine kinase